MVSIEVDMSNWLETTSGWRTREAIVTTGDIFKLLNGLKIYITLAHAPVDGRTWYSVMTDKHIGNWLATHGTDLVVERTPPPPRLGGLRVFDIDETVYSLMVLKFS